MKANKTPLQPFVDLYLRNHVDQWSISREMAGTIRRYFGPLLATKDNTVSELSNFSWAEVSVAVERMSWDGRVSLLRL